jgi:HlyD family secretion protein
MKKIIKITLLVMFVGVVLFTLYYLYQKGKQDPVVYEIVQPIKTNIIQRTVATGSVVPRKEIDIKPKISGIVEKLYVEPGDKVKEGDLIAKVRVVPNMLSLNEAESRLKRAESSFKKAELEFNRKQQLYDQKVIADAEYQTTSIQFENAKTELQTAEDNLQLIKEGVSKHSGSVTNTLVRSTIEGMVLQVPIEEGNSIIESNNFNDGTTIATVANMNEMIFKGKVDESEVGKLKAGMSLIMKIGAIEDHSFNASLEYISPKGIEENGAIQFEIEAAVQLVDTIFIRAGYSANADIVLARRDSVLAISESLIKFEEGKSIVEVETEANVFIEKEIKLGLSDGINVEVIGGITKDDKLKGKKK